MLPGRYCQKCVRSTWKELQQFFWEEEKRGGFEKNQGGELLGLTYMTAGRERRLKKGKKERYRKQGPSERKEADQKRKKKKKARSSEETIK